MTSDSAASLAPTCMQRHASTAKTALQRACRLDIDSQPGLATNTAIMCSIGPACADAAVLADMLEAGMGIARLSLSRSTADERRSYLQLLAQAEDLRLRRRGGAAARWPVAVAVDTRGREIRTGPSGGPQDQGPAAVALIATGTRVRVLCAPDAADKSTSGQRLWVNYPELARRARVGQAVHIDGGLLQLRVAEVHPGLGAVDCEVEVGGCLQRRRSVTLPGMDTGMPDLAPEDPRDLAELAAEPGTARMVCIVMASFVRSAETVRRVRAAARGLGGSDGPLIVAKICDAAGVRALDEIMAEADAVLVDRGKLGSELPQQKVFAVQKRILARCRVAGKASVCATQLLDSMIAHPRPTRAEASDVANAVMDGADCLMLSAETAVGKYPLEAVQTLAKICREAEAALHAMHSSAMLKRQLRGPADPLQGNAMAACEAAVRCHAAAIVVVSDRPGLPRLTAMYRPPCPILCACPDAELCRGLNLWYGVHPLHYCKPPKPDRMREANCRVRFAAAYAQSHGLLLPNSLVVVLSEKSASNCSDLLAIVGAVRLLAGSDDSDESDDEEEDDAVEKANSCNGSVDSIQAESGLELVGSPVK